MNDHFHLSINCISLTIKWIIVENPDDFSQYNTKQIEMTPSNRATNFDDPNNYGRSFTYNYQYNSHAKPGKKWAKYYLFIV